MMDGTDLKNIKSSTGGGALVYVTVAGQGAKAASDQDLIRLYQGGFEFDGLDFDMEGELGQETGKTPVQLLDRCIGSAAVVSKAVGKPLYVQITVQGGRSPEGDTAWAAPYTAMRDKYKGGGGTFVKQFNLSLMMYGDSMTSSGWPSCTMR